MSAPETPGSVLLVEDELHIARGLVFNLEAEGYAVTHVASGEEALARVRGNDYALLVLDLMLPGMDGLEVCRHVRKSAPRLPILMLTARSEEEDRVAGLASGADDYLTKPFSLAEFLLRVKGMIRRSRWYREEAGTERIYRFGRNVVDLVERKATSPRGTVDLTELEAKMLRAFLGNEGKVLSRSELLVSVWDIPPDSETRTLDNFVVRMRKYFEEDPSQPVHFLTVRGRGYRFVRRAGEGAPEGDAG